MTNKERFFAGHKFSVKGDTVTGIYTAEAVVPDKHKGLLLHRDFYKCSYSVYSDELTLYAFFFGRYTETKKSFSDLIFFEDEKAV